MVFIESTSNTPEETLDVQNPIVEHPDERIDINRAIQNLAPEFRSVFVLRVVEGYSVLETAKILKMSEGTIKSRLARAHDKLRSMLKDEFGDKYEK